MTKVTAPATVRHPLHPLTAAEISSAVQIIVAAKRLQKNLTRFISVSLKEPAKAAVYHFTEGAAFERNALVVLLDISQGAGGAVYEADVSIGSGQLVSWQHIPGVQPTMTADEQVECEEVVKNDPAFRAALKNYG